MNYNGTLTPRPSIICRKLNYKGKLDPESTEITPLHSTPNINFGYDSEEGIKVMLNQSNLSESISELKQWMADNKIPTTFEDRSMFFIDASLLEVDSIEVLESHGFIKDDTTNYIWELK